MHTAEGVCSVLEEISALRLDFLDISRWLATLQLHVYISGFPSGSFTSFLFFIIGSLSSYELKLLFEVNLKI